MLNAFAGAHRCAAMNLLRLIAAVLLLSAGGCEGTNPDRSARTEPDPLWAEYIGSHTSGVISRNARIRIVFATDVAAEDSPGGATRASLEIEPRVAGAVGFVSTRELVFTPERGFEPGRQYRIILRPDGLNGPPPDLEPFEFFVQIKRPEFEVTLGGLTSDASRTGSMSVRGEVVTSDVEQRGKVEQLVTATYGGKAIPIVWEHANADRHSFEIRGLRRANGEQVLAVRWDGEPIGAKQRGERRISVPARDRFIVTQVMTAEREGRRHIQVFFSDTLDARQDFKGLVRLSSGEPSVRVDGNLLHVYPEQAPEGGLTLTLEPGIRNRSGDELGSLAQYPVVFASAKPQVRFVGTGAILPDAPVLSVPFEAVGVRSIRVTAFRIHDDNLEQFLQVNPLGGSHELGRVGRTLWRKAIALNAPDLKKWNRFSLDLTELLQNEPGGMVRLSLSISRRNAIYGCGDAQASAAEEPLVDHDANDEPEASHWDYAEEYYNVADGSGWADRDNPCKDAYYAYGQNIRDARNFLSSNIGLIAKRDQHGRWIVVATDLRTGEPLDGVKLQAKNFQRQVLAKQTTDARGFAEFALEAAPFTFIAEHGGEKGYLRVQQGVALPVSHFDVGGEHVKAGIKAHIYGERGVWRPGDDIHLTFVLQDKGGTLPDRHPVTMELFNPQAQLTQTVVNTAPVNGFYAFKLKTAEDAPTGVWTAKAVLGGATFSKSLSIETVAPNRLKVALHLEQNERGVLQTSACAPAGEGCELRPRIRGKLSGQWLSGALASGLEADVKVRLKPTPTRFDRYADFTFDDPARAFVSDAQEAFAGALDAEGLASFEKTLESVEGAPGMLTASFTTRVFERGGAFSVNYASHPLSPYRRYVGLRLPKGDAARNMLRTDEGHTVELASLSAAGEPVAMKNVEVTLYKIDWKWWWDASGDALAQYAHRTHTNVVQQSTVSTAEGKGAWSFEIKYPAWGRYLIRACDLDGGHCTGRTFYIDWPMWAGRAQDQSGPAASVLVLTTDKEKYSVGDTATIQLPEAKEGRALFTIESGASILEARWIDLASESNRVALPITRAMAPNVYASVTLVQPHGKQNDRPIRLYGVVPIHVTDPATSLAPQLTAADEWRPNSLAQVEVSERSGRAMTYTLAVVDEGLLDLTSFRTPDLHAEFYRREALGVSTWDLFDEVAGAYTAELDRLLALGGSDAGVVRNPDGRRTRFPPVVRYLGPFELKANERRRHDIDVPQYIGGVRVMVVAGQRGAYGSTEKSIFVRQPLMLLPTLPRVLGPEEEVAVPVSVFVSDARVRRVSLRMQTDGAFEIIGDSTVTLDFTRPEEKLGLLKLRSTGRIGQGRVSFTATSGDHHAAADVYLDVRSPNPATTHRVQRALDPGETWSLDLAPHGLPGTNAVTLEVSAVPPLDLDRRLHYLISYPYGCLEQTTSAAFPQLYLPSLLKLEHERRREIQRNVQDGVHRLSGFQVPNGAFTYWPGGFHSPDARLRNTWSTSYAGHFLVEAKKLGYGVPDAMLANWARFQRTTAQGWSGAGEAESLDQAYRLYTLALAGQPEIGAMNRLRERAQLPAPARWLLAAGYKHAGIADAATALAKNAPPSGGSYAGREQIFGSELRDDAIALLGLVTLGRTAEADALADELSRSLASEAWHSTQSTAYALMAMAHYVGVGQLASFTFERTIDGKARTAAVDAPLYSQALSNFPDRGATVKITNTSNRRLFAAFITRGAPKAGAETAGAQGLSLSIEYRDDEGRSIDVSRLEQGADLIAQIVVANETGHRIDNIALAQWLPAGWEIHNERLEGLDAAGARAQETPARPWWWDAAAAATRPEHVDIRDDRIYRHFGLRPRERITFITRLNAAYRGRYYLPGVSVEAMYDASRYARSKGEWVEVVP